MIYVSPSQVLVKPLSAEFRGRGVILKSQYGYEITDVAIMGNDRYLVARTPDTLLLGKYSNNNNKIGEVFTFIMRTEEGSDDCFNVFDLISVM